MTVSTRALAGKAAVSQQATTAAPASPALSAGRVRPGAVQYLLATRAEAGADRLAIGAGRAGRSLNWSTLARRSGGWADRLRRGGVLPGTRVAIGVADPIDFVVAYLGLLSAGVTVVPIDPAAAHSEICRRLATFDVRVVITNVDTVLAAAYTTGAQLVWDASGAMVRKRAVPAPVDRRAGVLLATSGTTGLPKGVLLGEDRLLFTAAQIARHHALTPRDIGYCPLPLAHVNAQVVGVLSALMSGASLVVDNGFRRDFWDVAGEWRATWLNTVPAILAILADLPAPPAATSDRIRFARSASAPLPVATLRAFQAGTGIGVLETYGMTEVASQICANPLERADRRTGSVGLPVGMWLRVVDPEGRVCPPGESGSVQVRGPAVVQSYLVPSEPGGRRSAVTDDGWLVTGDVGMRDADGYVFLLGRADDVINRGGQKVHPREIEEVLRRHADVVDAVAVGRPHPTLGEEPVAFVRPRAAVDGGPDGEQQVARMLQELRSLCEHELSRYRRPVMITPIDQIPVGSTGKPNRVDLRATAASTAAAAVASTPPAPVPERLA